MASKINVTIWNEFRHEKSNDLVKELYPNGIHKAIAEGIQSDDLRLWNVAPSHPICAGLGEYIELPQKEMYGERVQSNAVRWTSPSYRAEHTKPNSSPLAEIKAD